MTKKNLKIIKRCRELMIEIHKMTLLLSTIQIFGEAKHVSQAASSVISSSDNSFRKKHYNYDFIKYLVDNHNASTGSHHLEALFEKGNLTPENLYAALKNKFERLCSIINGFNQSEGNEAIQFQ